MPVDDYLLDRLRGIMKSKNVAWTEKNMFGGVCFMVDDKMCFGPGPMGMMVRIDPEEEQELLDRSGVQQMMHGGRTMKGFLTLDEDTMDSDKELDFWIGKTLEFNPKAKSSKKK